MTLPPKPPPHDPGGPSQSEPDGGPGTPSSQGTLTHHARSRLLEHGGGARRPVVARLVLLGLSGLGILAAGVLWAAGHPALAARLLAGDVLLIFVLLLAL